MAIVDELVAILGYEVKGQENLNKFNKSLDQTRNRLAGFVKGVAAAGAAAAVGIAAIGTAAAGAGFALFKMASSAAKPLDDLIKSADRAGVSFEALQELGFAAEQSGSSVQELSSNLEELSARLVEAARGKGEAREALKAYGLSATNAAGDVKRADVFLMELSDRFKTLSEAQSLDLAKKLGISSGLVTMLRGGADAIEDLRKQARAAGLVFTEKEARNAERYNDALNLFQRSIEALRHSIGVDLLPTLTDLIDGMQKWLNANRELIRQNVGLLVQRFSRNTRTLVELLSRISVTPFYAIAAALGLILLRSSPVTRAIALIAVGLDDLLTYIRGGESVLGDFINWIRELTGVSEGTAQAIAGIATAIVALGLLKPSLILGPIFAGIRAAAPGLIASFVALFSTLANPIMWAIIIGGVAAAFAHAFWDDIKAVWDSINWAELGTAIGQGILNGLQNFGAAIRDWFASIIPDWAKGFFGGGIEKGAAPAWGAPRAKPLTGTWGTTTNAEPEWLSNLKGNIDRLATDRNVEAATITDNRQDNRQFPVTNNVTINQNVTQATNAPAAAAQATGNAVSNSLQRSQVEVEPSF